MKISSKTVSLILLFLFAVNFFNYESRIILIVFFSLMLLNQRRSLPITSTSILLGVYSIIYYIFAALYNPGMMTYYIIPFLLGPFIGYSIGIILMRKRDVGSEKLLKIIVNNGRS